MPHQHKCGAQASRAVVMAVVMPMNARRGSNTMRDGGHVGRQQHNANERGDDNTHTSSCFVEVLKTRSKVNAHLRVPFITTDRPVLSASRRNKCVKQRCQQLRVGGRCEEWNAKG
jgi:hypothetical protein